MLSPRSGKLQHLSPLTSPLLLTKCTECFRGILIYLMCISSPHLPFNTMTVIWQKGENKSRPNHRHPVSAEADIWLKWRKNNDTHIMQYVASSFICEHITMHGLKDCNRNVKASAFIQVNLNAFCWFNICKMIFLFFGCLILYCFIVYIVSLIQVKSVLKMTTNIICCECC